MNIKYVQKAGLHMGLVWLASVLVLLNDLQILHNSPTNGRAFRPLTYICQTREIISDTSATSYWTGKPPGWSET